MAKPELGEKRTCPECSARFYDLNKSPCQCPKCEHAFEPEVLLKSKRKPDEDALAAAEAKKAKEAEEAKKAKEAEEAGEASSDDDADIISIEDIDEGDDDDADSDSDDTLIALEDDDDSDVSVILDAPVETDKTIE